MEPSKPTSISVDTKFAWPIVVVAVTIAVAWGTAGQRLEQVQKDATSAATKADAAEGYTREVRGHLERLEGQVKDAIEASRSAAAAATQASQAVTVMANKVTAQDAVIADLREADRQSVTDRRDYAVRLANAEAEHRALREAIGDIKAIFSDIQQDIAEIRDTRRDTPAAPRPARRTR